MMKCFLKCIGVFSMLTVALAIAISALITIVIGLMALADYIAKLLGLGPIATAFIYFVEIAMLIAAATIISDRKKICS